VAKAIGLARAEEVPVPAPNGELRDQIVAYSVAALGGAEMGIGTWLKDQFKGVALGLGTWYAKRKRGAITDEAYPLAGHILLYQTRGGPIQDFIQTQIDAASPPVTLLAHSLGGIACVDLLVRKNMDQKVTRLITVGSQAPFLYEIDCLMSLRWKDPLPEHFPKWLNIYDQRDMLSYIGEGVFKDRVTDFPVDSGQPFPESHGAYWTNPKVWKEIVKFIG